jgi:hypothetical protein
VNNFRCTSAYRGTLKDESAIVRAAMDAAYFWQKAATCLRLAQTLSLNNPGRISLLEMAQAFERRAKEIEATRIETTRIAPSRAPPSRAQSNEDTLEDIKRERRAIGIRRRFV